MEAFLTSTLVVIGTTLGMMITNVPVVLLGSAASHRFVRCGLWLRWYSPRWVCGGNARSRWLKPFRKIKKAAAAAFFRPN